MNGLIGRSFDCAMAKGIFQNGQTQALQNGGSHGRANGSGAHFGARHSKISK
jgi:hypothetical protein